MYLYQIQVKLAIPFFFYLKGTPQTPTPSLKNFLFLPVLLTFHLRGCSWLGAILHLKQETGGHKEDGRVTGSLESTRGSSLSRRVGVRAGVQAHSDEDETRQRKLVCLTKNGPAQSKSKIKNYTVLAKTGAHHDSGDNSKLATVCGEHDRACTLATPIHGDPDTIRNMPERTAEK